MPEEQFTKICPRCGAVLPIHFGFRTWCDQCGWNLTREMPEPSNQFMNIWRRLGKKSAPKLLEEAKMFSNLRPRMSRQLILAYGLALLVHAFTLWLVYCAGWLLLLAGSELGHEFLILFLARVSCAALLLLLFWKVRPRLPRATQEMLHRGKASTLFRLLDRISEGTGLPRLEVVELTPEYAAGLELAGPQGDIILRLGLPLLYALSPQELVAALARAVAQSVSGSPLRIWLIHSAIGSLKAWHELFLLDRPSTTELEQPPKGELLAYPVPGLRFRTVPINIVTRHPMMKLLLALLRVLAVFPWLIARGIAMLIYPEMQRAEYRADGWSAQIGGTQAALSALRKQYLEDCYQSILEKTRLHIKTRIFKETRERLAAIPEREMQRIERIIAQGDEPLCLDPEGVLPPTRDRIEFLLSRPEERGQVQVSQMEYTQILAEIAPYELALEDAIFQTMPEKI